MTVPVSSITTLSPQPVTVAELMNRAIVNIFVRNNKLSVFPRRQGDVVVYYSRPGVGSPEKARQVLWVVDGLPSNQRIEIRGKDGTHPFTGGLHDIGVGENLCHSTDVKTSVGKQGMTWSYSIALYDGKVLIHQLDPDVVIKDDP